MKNLKKLLAVVLVVVMAFSLMAMASAAGLKDYADAGSVAQKEAVNVMVGAGIMTGDGTTNWNPDGTFTREMAAKVIACLLSVNAGKFKVSVSSFSDVKVTDWSSPYIEYCVSRGIINGLGDGTFAPKAPVTGTAFAKMLLTALGYGKNNEYIGSNWEINVLDDALNLGILSLDVNYSAAATREEVAQYALNALFLPQAVYSKDTGLYTTQTAGVDNATLGSKTGLTKETSNANGVNGYYYAKNLVAITESYANDIVLATIKDGTVITAYTSTSSTKYVAPFAATCAYTLNGIAIPVLADGATSTANQLYVGDDNVLRVAASTTTDYDGAGGDDDAEYSVNGAIVNLIDDPTTVAKDIFKINIVEKKVGYIDPLGTGVTVTPVLNLDSNVKIDLLTVTDITGTVKTVVGYDGLAKGDVVLYYTIGTTTYVEKAASFTGAVTAITGTTYTIAGAGYKMSELAQTIGTPPVLGDATATYYVDNGNNIVYITGPANAVADKYAMVLAYGWTPANILAGVNASSKAQLLLDDGTVAIFDLVTNNGQPQDDSLTAGRLVKYLATDKTITVCTPVTTTTLTGTMTVTTATPTTTVNGTTTYLTSNTLFFFYNGSTDFGVVKGIANVPTSSSVATDVVAVDAISNVAAAVMMPETFGAVAGTATYAYVTNATPTQTLETVNGIPNQTVYSYSAIVNGAATTLKSLTDEDDNSSAIAVGLYSVAATNGYYAYTALTLEQEAQTVTIADASFFVCNGTLYNITPTTQVYKATMVAGAITELKAESMAVVPGSTMKASVEASGSNALVAIFWYE